MPRASTQLAASRHVLGDLSVKLQLHWVPLKMGVMERPQVVCTGDYFDIIFCQPKFVIARYTYLSDRCWRMAENKDAAVLRAEGRSELHNRQRRIASRLTNRCLPVTYREFEVLEDTQKIRCLVCNNGRLYGFPKLTRKQEEDAKDPLELWARLSGTFHLHSGGHGKLRVSGIERLIKEAGALALPSISFCRRSQGICLCVHHVSKAQIVAEPGAS